MTLMTYIEEITAFQQDKEETLRAPDGWLTLAGLHWLEKGPNMLGSSPESDIPLPEGSVPSHLGTLHLSADGVTLELNEGQTVEINNEIVSGAIALESDINRNPTIVHLDSVSFFIIQRGNRTGVRVKDTNQPTLINFTGRIWWPVDEACRVTAEIKPYDPPKPVQIPDVLGGINDSQMECALEFDIQGEKVSLDAQAISDDRYYIIFHDRSAGKGSYPAGRFLVTEKSEGAQVVIDFNKAYNPPCAFTDFATCPFPPRQNYLSVSIQAGERYRPMDQSEH